MSDRERFAVFAYGSLVCPRSAALTLGRPPQESWPPDAAVAATLMGWRRRFSQARDNRACEKTFALDADGSIPDFVLGLNVERTGRCDDAVEGLAFAVDAAELARLDRRELRYDRINVAAEVEPSEAVAALGRLHVYTAKEENLALEPPAGAVVLRSYVAAVEDAFSRLGPDALATYRSSTGPPAVAVVDAHLIGDRIPSGNPRGW